MMFYYALLFTMTIIASFASFFLKKTASSKMIYGIVKNRYLYFGGFLYTIAAIINIWLLKKIPYSIVVPLGSMCYIWTMLIAAIFLNEKIKKRKILSLFLIISGIILLTFK